jgi:hypothetical protein
MLERAMYARYTTFDKKSYLMGYLLHVRIPGSRNDSLLRMF